MNAVFSLGQRCCLDGINAEPHDWTHWWGKVAVENWAPSKMLILMPPNPKAQEAPQQWRMLGKESGLDMTRPLCSCSEYMQLQLPAQDQAKRISKHHCRPGDRVAEWIQSRHSVYKYKMVKERIKAILTVDKGLKTIYTCSVDTGERCDFVIMS